MKALALAWLVVFFASACGPAPILAETQTPLPADPTSPPTSTPVPPSDTPRPTEIPTRTTTPTPTPAPTLTPTSTATADPCWQQGGVVEKHTLSTNLSPLPWEFRVYTPPCYQQQPDRSYPLLILIHGSTYTDSQWDDLGADETTDRLVADGRVPPFIILMPRDRVWVEPTEDPFGEALIEHILPWVDANYRTIPDRDHRAIGGLSRGASWAVHLGLKHWSLFSAIGAHSLPVFLTDPPRIRTWLDEIPADRMPRFYIDIGDKDYLLDQAVWFENLLTEKNIPHEWYLNSGRHETAYWEAHVEQYLQWYAVVWGDQALPTGTIP